MIGRKRSRHASRIASSGARPRLRCASIAKSTSMMPLFLTMPISRMMPISAIRLKSKPKAINVTSAPRPGRRQGREDRQRVDVALIEYAQDDVDDDDRCGD